MLMSTPHYLTTVFFITRIARETRGGWQAGGNWHGGEESGAARLHILESQRGIREGKLMTQPDWNLGRNIQARSRRDRRIRWAAYGCVLIIVAVIALLL